MLDVPAAPALCAPARLLAWLPEPPPPGVEFFDPAPFDEAPPDFAPSVEERIMRKALEMARNRPAN